MDSFPRAANKLPQIWWLNTTGTDSLPILRPEISCQGEGRAMLPPKALGQNLPFLFSSSWWV